MSEKTISSAGNEILQAHSELFKDLVKIPEIRQIGFRIDMENNLSIGKPRFEPLDYQWSPDYQFTRIVSKIRLSAAFQSWNLNYDENGESK